MMVDVGSEQGTIQITEKLMINNIFEFNNKVVSDIAAHRMDLSVLSIDASLQETIQLVNLDQYTGYPVYYGNIDNIVGILHVKDLFQFIDQENEKPFDLKELVRTPYFVLETQGVDILFTDMQKNNIHIAIVLDEYGGTEGLITIEDVIEEIVGEISSESEGPEEEEIKQLATNRYSVAGIVYFYKLEDILKVDLPTKDFDNLSGLLIGEIGYIPSIEERPVITYKNLFLKLLK